MRRFRRSADDSDFRWWSTSGWVEQRNGRYHHTLTKANDSVADVKANDDTPGWVILDDSPHVEGKLGGCDGIVTANRPGKIAGTDRRTRNKASFTRAQKTWPAFAEHSKLV